jgi:hypothetical protein
MGLRVCIALRAWSPSNNVRPSLADVVAHLTSTQLAQVTLVLDWMIAAVTLTSASRTGARRQPFSVRRYVVALLLCSLVLGAILMMTDRVVGRTGTSRAVEDLGFALGVSSLALGAGAWWTHRTAWASMSGPSRWLTLFLLEAFVVLLASYPFI